MDQHGEMIHLYSTDTYITENSRDAFRVHSGTVLVFIAPLKSGRPDIRRLLCEVTAGHLIPSFSYRDADYVNWRFVLLTRDEAEIECLPNMVTSVLLRRFAKTAGLVNFQQEGFEQSLVEAYKRESLKDNVFIDLGDKQKPGVNIANYGVIQQAFDEGEERIDSDSPLYRAMAYACRHSAIDLISAEKLRHLCGDAITVANIARASRIACRNVVLEQGWYKKDSGTIISSIDDHPVACVPRGQDGYTIYYGETGEKAKLTQAVAETVEPKASLLIRSLPGNKLKVSDLVRFSLKSIRRTDVIWIIVLGLVGALIGILLPTLNQKIYDDYIPLGDYDQLIQICLVIATFMIGNLFFDMVKKLTEFRISSHVDYDLQNAIYYRVFHLPESFFREYESADLAQRLDYIGPLGNTFTTSTLITGLSTVFSLLYLFRMFVYSKRLAWWALIMLAAYAVILFLVSRRTIRFDKDIERLKGSASAKLYQFLTGIEKIRMAGVEDRAAYEYLLPYAEKQTLEISKNRFSAISTVLSGTVTTLFSMVFYLIVVKNNVELTSGKYMAFNSAFGSFSAAIIAMIGGMINLYQLKPQYDRIAPVLNTAIEDEGEKEAPGTLKGEVSLDKVTFAYDKNGSNVLNGIDLKIRPGEYLGIVGSSGCGKSTLLKLLLGFEEPDQGQVCYDGKNLRQLDKREVRKNLGVVLQNGKLIAGSIFENITITAPNATMKDVKSVIEAVGLKQDIDQMPMGVHTVLSETSGTISGGQQQRILIARAIISHPAILILDEATSALDNVTQAAVCESLDKMNVTRIVVAHRLSTIKNCDRIVVMSEGKIVEEGNYDFLMKQGGLFYRLASRQLVD